MTILTHPANVVMLREQFPAGALANLHPSNPWHDPGVEVLASPMAPRYFRKWAFPRDPFVEYGPEDEAWARPIGFGHEVDDTSRPWFAKLEYAKPYHAPMYSMEWDDDSVLDVADEYGKWLMEKFARELDRQLAETYELASSRPYATVIGGLP